MSIGSRVLYVVRSRSAYKNTNEKIDNVEYVPLVYLRSHTYPGNFEVMLDCFYVIIFTVQLWEFRNFVRGQITV